MWILLIPAALLVRAPPRGIADRIPASSGVDGPLGPMIGGWFFDTFGGYAWLYIGSFALGLGAVAIALAFPPLYSRRGALKPA